MINGDLIADVRSGIKRHIRNLDAAKRADLTVDPTEYVLVETLGDRLDGLTVQWGAFLVPIHGADADDYVDDFFGKLANWASFNQGEL